MRSTVFYRRPLSWNPEIFPCQRFLYISVRRLSINYNRLFWREQPLNLSPGNSVRIENLVIRKSRTGLANDTYKIPGLTTDLEIASSSNRSSVFRHSSKIVLCHFLSNKGFHVFDFRSLLLYIRFIHRLLTMVYRIEFGRCGLRFSTPFRYQNNRKAIHFSSKFTIIFMITTTWAVKSWPWLPSEHCDNNFGKCDERMLNKMVSGTQACDQQ